MLPTPRIILETLLPHLQVAANYAKEIQPRIAAQPDKPDMGSTFAAALSDADLSIQALVEVALLGTFPQLHFYGEEYEKSYNTKYFKSLDIPQDDNYLVLLDPIDGTQFYLDGHANYHIIISIVDRQDYCAALMINPVNQAYFYALRGEGAYYGTFAETIAPSSWTSLQTDVPVTLAQERSPESSVLYLGSQLTAMKPHLPSIYPVVNLATDYSKTIQSANHTDVLTGILAGSALASAKLIDVAAIAFIAQEAGCIVTTLAGNPPPPLTEILNPDLRDYSRPGGVIIAANAAIHHALLTAAIEAKVAERLT